MSGRRGGEEDCIFCKVAEGRSPATIVLENDDVVAFRDIRPQAPTHLLVIPRRHIASLNELSEEDDRLAGQMLRAARDLAAAEGLGSGYRVVTNTGSWAGQTVAHLHFHVLGGRRFGWPPG